jgi:hypothetical protein
MKLLDSQDRMWFSGVRVRLADNPDDFLHLVRLLPDGSLDPSFATGRVEAVYPFGWYVPPVLVSVIIEPDLDDDVFFIGGVFSHYNDTAQPSISALSDDGYILNNFFGNQGCTVNSYDPDDPNDLDAPAVRALEHLVDGSLMVGGSFSDFMGVERYSMVKLNQGTVSIRDQDRLEGKMKVYPNPANEYVQLEYELLFAKRNTVMNVYDQVGRKVNSYTIGTNTKGVEILDTRKLVSGLYIVEIVQEGQHVSSEKFIVQH